jgi:hypothetical protein
LLTKPIDFTFAVGDRQPPPASACELIGDLEFSWTATVRCVHMSQGPAEGWISEVYFFLASMARTSLQMVRTAPRSLLAAFS